MPERKSPLILTGPTTVGKSEVANGLADRIGGHIINADKYFLYANSFFTIGLGLAPGELDDGRPRHLYGALSAETPLPTEPEFLNLVDSAARRVHELGATAIIEGCSYRFNMALIARYGLEHAVNLTWADREGLGGAVQKRIDGGVVLGLYEETKRALDAGFEGTFPMTSMLYRPAVRVLRGEITHDEAVQLINENAFDNTLQHDEWYQATPGLVTIPHDQTNIPRTVDAVLSHFNYTEQ